MANEERNARIRQLRGVGWSLARIGREVGLSASRVGRILDPAPEEARRKANAADKKRYDAARYVADKGGAKSRMQAWRDAHPAEFQAGKNRAMHKWQAESLPDATNHRQPWTDADMVVLLREDLTTRQMAKLLGRTFDSVNNMRYRVRRNPPC